MYPQYWVSSIGGTYQNRKAEAAAQKYGAAASAFFAVPPARADSSVPSYFSPAKGRFCPPYLCPQGRPAFPRMAACFTERSYYAREKALKYRFGHLFCCFFPFLQCFFAKKTLQINFKNILYNYKLNIFTQIVSYRFV
jgi:hypothetical protein